MEIKIYNQEEREEEDPNIYLKLIPNSDGVCLCMINKITGKRIVCGSILTITNDGYLKLCHNINDNVGLQVGNNNKILIQEN